MKKRRKERISHRTHAWGGAPFLVPITVPPRDAASGASHLSATIVSALVHGYVSTTLFRFVIFVFRPIVACQFSLLRAIPRLFPAATGLVFLASRFSSERFHVDAARCSSFFNRIARVCLPFLDPLEPGWHACLTERLTSELLVKATARLPTCRYGSLRNHGKERRPVRRSVSLRPRKSANEPPRKTSLLDRLIRSEVLLSRSQTCRAFFTARSISFMLVISRFDRAILRLRISRSHYVKKRVWTWFLYHSFYFILFTVYLYLLNLCQSVYSLELIADIIYI